LVLCIYIYYSLAGCWPFPRGGLIYLYLYVNHTITDYIYFRSKQNV
jgi:hypothetical protein